MKVAADGWGGGWSPDGSLTYVGGDGGLWGADADGSNLEKLLASLIGWPSPDGSHIAYESYSICGRESCPSSVWVADADGSNRVKVSDNGGFQGVVS